MTKKVGSVATPPVVDTPKVAESAPVVEEDNEDFDLNADHNPDEEFSSVSAPAVEAEEEVVADNATLAEDIDARTAIPDGTGADPEESEVEGLNQTVAGTDSVFTGNAGLAAEVKNTPSPIDLVEKPKAEEANVPKSMEVVDNPMTWLYDKLTPKPKERTPEEQAKFERQRKASAIILSIADAINGISNLGATVAGAPSKEIQSITGKWNEVLEASEKERQGKIDTWYANRHKAAVEDFKYNRDLKQRKADKDADNAEYDRRAKAKAEQDAADRRAAHENQKELLKIKGEMEKSAEERANNEWTRREGIRHANEVKEIKTRAKSAAEYPKNPKDTHKEYFSANVNGTPVDVYLRDNEDYNRLYDILEKTMNAGSAEDKDVVSKLKAELNGQDRDTTFAKKRDFVRANFAKYYDKLKNNPDFIHLSTQFRDNKGKVLEFKEEKTAYDPSKDPIVKGAAETQKILAEKEGPLMSSGILSNYGFELVDSPWYNKK